MSAVARLDVATYAVRTDAPEADGALAWDSPTLVVVRAVADDGTTGLGWTYAGRACQTLVQDQLAEVVLGRDVLDGPGSLEAIVRACRNLGRPGMVSGAIAAVDIALWDVKARLLDLLLCRLLGQVHQQVPVYGSGGFTSYHDGQFRAQLELWAHEMQIPASRSRSASRGDVREPRPAARAAGT